MSFILVEIIISDTETLLLRHLSFMHYRNSCVLHDVCFAVINPVILNLL